MSSPLRLVALASASLAVSLRAAGPAEDFLGRLEKEGYSFQEPARRQALFAAVARVADPGARVFGDAEKKTFEERLKGLSYQPGIRCSSTNGTLQVLEILPATPAIHAGIQARSVLLAVNGQAVTSNRFSSTLQRLRGTEPGKVTLEWKTTEGVSRRADIPLALMAEPPVQLQELLPGGFGYLRLNGVYRDSGDWISRLLLKWDRENCPGLVLDLRDAGGNDLDAALRIAGPAGAAGRPLVTLRTRAGAPVRAATAPEGDILTMPVLVLVNRATHGAAELLAAILQRSGRGAMVVGEPTAGDPLVRDFLPVDDGVHLRLAVRVAVFPNGTTLDGSAPLEPDIRVEDRELPPPVSASSLEWEAFTGDRAKAPDAEAMARATRVGRDAVLQRGLDILLGLRALNLRAAERPSAPPP